MSIEALTWALTVPVGGNAKVILLGLANHAHPDGSNSWPSWNRLAVYAHCDRATVHRHLTKLEEAGWIARTGEQRRGVVVYQLAMTPHTDPSQNATGGNLRPVAPLRPPPVAPVRPEPSVEPSKQKDSPGTTSAGVRASARDSGLQTHDGGGEEADDVALAEYVRGVLQRGVDSLTTTEQVRAPSRQAVLKALREHPVDPFDAKTIAADVRAIVQAQNRAPNVVGLYAKRLAEHAERHRMPPAA